MLFRIVLMLVNILLFSGAAFAEDETTGIPACDVYLKWHQVCKVNTASKNNRKFWQEWHDRMHQTLSIINSQDHGKNGNEKMNAIQNCKNYLADIKKEHPNCTVK